MPGMRGNLRMMGALPDMAVITTICWSPSLVTSIALKLSAMCRGREFRVVNQVAFIETDRCQNLAAFKRYLKKRISITRAGLEG
jgi:hypothetical protein